MAPHPPLFTALLTMLLALPAPQARAGDCETLQVLGLGRDLIVLAGSRAQDSQVPELRLSGCGSASPDLELRWKRSASGAWSPAAELPSRLRGAGFGHRRRVWSLSLETRMADGKAGLVYGPLEPDSLLRQSSALHGDGALAVAVATLDDWSFSIVEQLIDGRLLLDVLTSFGPLESIERSSSLAVPSPWPAGSRLLGVAGDAESIVAFGRSPDGGLHVVRASGEVWSAGPALDLPPSSEVHGVWFAGAPAAVVVADDEIRLHALDGSAWSLQGQAPVPRSGAWAVASFGPDRRAVAAVTRLGDDLQAWAWRDGAWRQEHVPSGRQSSVIEPPKVPQAATSAPRPRRALLALGALAAIVGAVLATRLLRRR